jgi:MFS family permease
MLATTVSTPLYGKLGDLWGRKRLFQVAIVIFLVGSILAGLATSMAQLVAFRGSSSPSGASRASVVGGSSSSVRPSSPTS